MKTPLAFTLALLLASAITASAADMTVFGLELGKPLNLPICDADSVRKGFWTGVDQPCVYDVSGRSLLDDDLGHIRYPVRESPDIVRGADVGVVIAGGKLAGVSFVTAGYDSADFVLKRLIEKYKKPSRIDRKVLVNRLGGPVRRLTALWNLPGLTVVFQADDDLSGTGMVLIETAAGAKVRKRIESGGDKKDRLPL